MDINIIGMGFGKKLADGVPGERWGLTRTIYTMPMDVVFDIHDYTDVVTGPIMEKCKETGTKHYTCENFPLVEMIKEFRTAYFTSSAAYALAMAITKKPDSINLFGVNCSHKNNTEYFYQKPCIDFWVGVAMGRGINVTVNGKISEVRRAYKGILYGYWSNQADLEAKYVRSL